MFYVEGISKDRTRLKGCSSRIASMESWDLYFPRRGYQYIDEKTGEQFVVLKEDAVTKAYRDQIIIPSVSLRKVRSQIESGTEGTNTDQGAITSYIHASRKYRSGVPGGVGVPVSDASGCRSHIYLYQCAAQSILAQGRHVAMVVWCWLFFLSVVRESDGVVWRLDGSRGDTSVALGAGGYIH